jgi:cell division protein FtsL
MDEFITILAVIVIIFISVVLIVVDIDRDTLREKVEELEATIQRYEFEIHDWEWQATQCWIWFNTFCEYKEE